MAPTSSPIQPQMARWRWLVTASCGLGMAVAAVMIERVAWPSDLAAIAAWIGRFHPLVLHFPIVLLVLAFGFETCRLPGLRWLLPRPPDAVVTSVLGWAAVGCTVALACGWLLAQNGQYEQQLLDRHLWAGAITAFGANLALVFRVAAGDAPSVLCRGVSVFFLITTCAVLIAAGHYGAGLTHGADYLTENAPDGVRRLVGLRPRGGVADVVEIKPVGQRLLWADVARPLLDEHCASCHREGKAKGGLRLDEPAAILSGGGSGPAIRPGNALASLILQRMRLDIDDPAHMPPPGKPQPTADHLAALEWWIDQGAPTDVTVAELNPSPEMVKLLEPLLTPAQRKMLATKTAAEAAALDAALVELGRSLTGRLQFIVPGKPELAYAAGIHAATVGDSELQALTPVASRVVRLELQQTRVTDAGLVGLGAFGNLRELQLQNTPVTDVGLEHIGKLKVLEKLNLYGTGVTDAGLQHLTALKSLRKIDLWQTKVTAGGAAILRDAVPGLQVNLGLDGLPQDPPQAAPAKAAVAP